MTNKFALSAGNFRRVAAGAFLVAALFHATGRGEGPPDDLFPFVLPWNAVEPGPTQLDYGGHAPAGAGGFVRVRDGHFFIGEGDAAQRLRLLGVNFSFGMNFPDRELADTVASRLAKFGVNAVRFHHMDNTAAPRGIFQPDMKSLDPDQVEKLDYLFSKLKAAGIYGDINLKVSRNYPEFAGLKGLQPMHKGVDLFDRTMIEEQKQYARDLLTHVNPYTGLSYANDPAVALVEINNENGLLANWWRGKLDDLPEPFAGEFATLWNEWIKKEFGDVEKAAAQCAPATAPLGKMLVQLGPDENAMKNWRLQSNKTVPDFQRTVTKDGAALVQLRLDNDIQGNDEAGEYGKFVSPAFALEQGKIYTVSLKAKASPARSVTVEVGDADLTRAERRVFFANLTEEPQTLTYSFQWNHPSVAQAVVDLGELEKKSGQIEVAAFSVQEGGEGGRALEVENGAARVVRKSDYALGTDALRLAWMRFLWETERSYWQEMKDFLRHDLGVRCPIVGTQLGAYSAFPLQLDMDAIDIHTYWKHPQYDAVDRNAWTVGPESMLEDIGGGTIPAIALRRVAGKPYICTEYNHVTPNLYAAEGLVVGPAYAAFQDMDAVFVYSYSHYPEKRDAGKLPSLFDIDQHPLKMATLPIAAALFRRADVAPARSEKTVGISLADALRVAADHGTRVDGFAFGVSTMDPLRQATTIRLAPDGEKTDPPRISREVLGDKAVESDTGQLRWIPVDKKKSVFVADTKNSKCVAGFSDGRTYPLGDLAFAPSGNWHGWSVLALSSAANQPLGEPGRSLLVACGRTENTGWEWKNPRGNSLKSWGNAPSLVNGVHARLTWKLPRGKTLSVWALDERGQRKNPVPTSATLGGWVVDLDPKYRTIWYELEVR